MQRWEQLEHDTRTDQPFEASSLPQAERIRAAEVRLAVVSAEIGSRALDFLVAEPAKDEQIIRRAGELLLISSRIFSSRQEIDLLRGLDRSLEPESGKDAAKKILGRIPLAIYEVLSVLEQGASRAQAAKQLGVPEDYVWEKLREVYELFEVTRPDDALKAITEVAEAAGHGRLLQAEDINGDPRHSLPEELEELSDTELDILGCISMGLPNKLIAQERFVTEQTIKFHLTGIYGKLNVNNRTAAARIATQAGLIGWAMSINASQELMRATRKVYANKGEKGR